MSTSPPPAPASPIDRLLEKMKLNRAYAAITGGMLGLSLAVTGFVLPFTKANIGKLTGGLDKWRENWGFLLLVLACHLGGLLLMFISLQLVRGEERRSQNIRRLIYGFNAIYGTLLLLDVLALVNLLAYTEPIDQATGRFLSREFDWTQDRLYTLHPKTVSFFDKLEDPVKAYVIIPPNYIGASDTTALLKNIQTRTKKLTWEVVSPLGSPETKARIQELMKKYVIKDPLGVLLIVGDEKGKHDHDFIPLDKLVKVEGRRRDSYSYEGEGVLLGSLTSLIEGNVVIYVTEGHGELTLDSMPMMPGMPRPKAAGGLSTLKERMTANRNKFEMKPLKLDRTTTKVPEDASAVIIARPRDKFQERDLAVLREYLTRKEERHPDGKVKVAPGRLFVLFDLITADEKSVVKTGLEEFLRGYGVKVGDDRVQAMESDDPVMLFAVTNPESPTPLGRAFFNDRNITRFVFDNVRTVTPLEKGGMASAKVDPLMLVPAGLGIWAETDLSRSPKATADLIAGNTKMQEKLLSRDPLSIAVTVTESTGGGMPRDAAHMPALKERPLMIVFGNASWISDAGLVGGRGTQRFDLFSSCLSWLRGQSDIGVDVGGGKKRKDYDMNVPPTEQSRLVYLPLALMLLTVIALGTGVWVIRRR